MTSIAAGEIGVKDSQSSPWSHQERGRELSELSPGEKKSQRGERIESVS